MPRGIYPKRAQQADEKTMWPAIVTKSGLILRDLILSEIDAAKTVEDACAFRIADRVYARYFKDVRQKAGVHTAVKRTLKFMEAKGDVVGTFEKIPTSVIPKKIYKRGKGSA